MESIENGIHFTVPKHLKHLVFKDPNSNFYKFYDDVYEKHGLKSWETEKLLDKLNLTNNRTMKYLAKLAYCFAEKDDYEKGAIGETFDKTYDLEFEGNSLENVKEKIKEFLGVDHLEKDDEIFRTARHELNDGSVAYKEDVEEWQEGNKELWYVDFGFEIYKCEQIT